MKTAKRLVNKAIYTFLIYLYIIIGSPTPEHRNGAQGKQEVQANLKWKPTIKHRTSQNQ